MSGSFKTCNAIVGPHLGDEKKSKTEIMGISENYEFHNIGLCGTWNILLSERSDESAKRDLLILPMPLCYKQAALPAPRVWF